MIIGSFRLNRYNYVKELKSKNPGIRIGTYLYHSKWGFKFHKTFRSKYKHVKYEDLITSKMVEDIHRHTQYIIKKINDNNLDGHSFYFFVLPFMDAESDKFSIMKNVMTGEVVL